MLSESGIADAPDHISCKGSYYHRTDQNFELKPQKKSIKVGENDYSHEPCDFRRQRFKHIFISPNIHGKNEQEHSAMPLSLSVATERTNPIISLSFLVSNFATYIAGFAI
jgi:hypothetical protein